MFVLQLTGVWILFLIVAILNGGLRERFIEKHLSELAAHQFSTLLLSIAIFTITAVFIKHKGIKKNKQLLAIGVFWVAMTVAFEFLFFHYVSGKPWTALLADYNIFKGRLFSVVVFTTMFSPLIASRLFIKNQSTQTDRSRQRGV